MSDDVLHDLELLFRSRHSLILLETPDEERVRTLLRHLADRMGLPLFSWSRSRGLSRVDVPGQVYETGRPEAALAHVGASDLQALYLFHGLAPAVEPGSVVASQLVDAGNRLSRGAGAVVISGPDVQLPPEVEPHATRVGLPGPDPEEYRSLLSEIIRDFDGRTHLRVSLSEGETTRLIDQLRGLTLMEAEKILTKAIVEDGRLTMDDLRHVLEAKRSIIEKEGLLEYYPLEKSLTEIADLVRLKAWLGQRGKVLEDPEKAREFGLTFPRGVLLLGVPGCGKSLSAKAVATEWRLPLLKLDPSNLYNKYIGESEKNFKRAMATAEKMSPVILWVDEIEKAFAAGGTEDGGVSMRILGSFLSWMQERDGDVFVVATANDIERLPPELLRKGRFDEIFFVDLPDADTRKEIFRIHLEKREQRPADFDLEELARASDGFTGAEIEQVVLSGLYAVFSDGDDLSTRRLMEEIGGTRPLSVTMAEKVRGLREWARGRTVPAN